MKRVQKPERSEDYYTPSPYLAKLISELLQVEQIRRKHERKKVAGEKVSAREIEDFNMKVNRANRNKTNILNKHVFRAMANLTILLEKMQSDPYIRERFEDEIKSLFFTMSKQDKNNAPIFLRFLLACLGLSPNRQQRQDNRRPDFRAILGEYMQRAVYRMIEEMEGEFVDEELKQNTILFDMQRSLSYTKQFSRLAGIQEFDMDTRPPKF